MADRPKVNLNAIPELKNTTDDAIAPYMKSLGFKQSNLLTDVRLAVGFTACGICAVTFYYDYTLGFEKTKHLTTYAVVTYFLLNTFLTWWMWWVEGGKVYVGQRDGVKLVLESHCEKYSPIYELKATATTADGKTTTTEAKNAFVGWYDQQGYFVTKPFTAFLQNSIPALAEKGGKEAAVAAAPEKGVKKTRKGGKN